MRQKIYHPNVEILPSLVTLASCNVSWCFVAFWIVLSALMRSPSNAFVSSFLRRAKSWRHVAHSFFRLCSHNNRLGSPFCQSLALVSRRKDFGRKVDYEWKCQDVQLNANLGDFCRASSIENFIWHTLSVLLDFHPKSHFHVDTFIQSVALDERLSFWRPCCFSNCR
jgi:hypothetical protein